jgi:membrane fusion protein (multidrug efflux system)
MWARFKVSETQYLTFVKSGKLAPAHTPPIQLILADNSIFPSPGKIENALNQLDARTGTLEIQATFPNPKHNLLPGQFGRIRFETDLKKDVVTVPQRAIIQTQNTQSVYTVGSDNKIQVRAVTTSDRSGDFVIVNQGIRPGDRVVVEGQLRVQPGMTVRSRPYQDTNGAK